LPLLAPDHRDDRPVGARDKRDQRSEIELVGHLRAVGHGLRQGHRAPVVVETGRKDGKPPGAVPLEVVVEPVGDPVEVLFQGDALVMREVLPVGLLRRVQHRVHPRLGVAGGRDLRRIKVEVEADRAALLGPEGG
jgi:hypothetical protein